MSQENPDVGGESDFPVYAMSMADEGDWPIYWVSVTKKATTDELSTWVAEHAKDAEIRIALEEGGLSVDEVQAIAQPHVRALDIETRPPSAEP